VFRRVLQRARDIRTDGRVRLSDLHLRHHQDQLPYQIPLLIGITLRGRPGDRAKFHQSNGLYLESVIQAIDIPFVPIENADDIPRIGTAYNHSRTMSRPVVVGLTREVLRGEA
jgi:sulfopyruvate decarboxylase TPP-binding subunit